MLSRRAGLSATAGLSCLLEFELAVFVLAYFLLFIFTLFFRLAPRKRLLPCGDLQPRNKCTCFMYCYVVCK